MATVELNSFPLRDCSFLFPNRIDLILYSRDELWMYEIDFVINHNQVYLRNVNFEYVQDIANKRRKEKDDINIHLI